MNRFLPVALAAASLLIGAQPSLAADGDDVVSVHVRYGDLDLRHEDGAHAMLSRLTAASREVCGPEPLIIDLDQRAEFDSCVKDTLGRAVRSLDAPMVSALWDGRTVTEDMASASGAH